MLDAFAKACLVFGFGSSNRETFGQGRFDRTRETRGWHFGAASGAGNLHQIMLQLGRQQCSEGILRADPIGVQRTERTVRVTGTGGSNRVTKIGFAFLDKALGEKRSELPLQIIRCIRAGPERIEIRKREGLIGDPIHGSVVEILFGLDAVERIAEPPEETVEQKAAIVSQRWDRPKRLPA